MEVMEQFSDQSKVKKLYKKAENMYLMKSYKIANVSSEESIESYDRLLAKYQLKLFQIQFRGAQDQLK